MNGYIRIELPEDMTQAEARRLLVDIATLTTRRRHKRHGLSVYMKTSEDKNPKEEYWANSNPKH